MQYGPSSACFACSMVSPCIDPEQSITMAKFSGRGCCSPGKNGWKLATAATPSPSEPHSAKLHVACGAFTLRMKSRSLTPAGLLRYAH